MFDIISIGDAMQDHFIDLKEVAITRVKKDSSKLICLNFPDKVPAESIDSQVAGNAANVAVSSSRLGLKSAFYSVVGDDFAGEAIQQKMIDEKVSTKYIITDKNKKNNYSFVLIYKGERTIIIYHEPRKYKLPRLEKTKWIYLTSLGNTDGNNKSFIKLHEDVLKLVKKSNIKLAFNPGTFQLRIQKKLLKSIIKETEVLFLNKEEALNILKLKKDFSIKELLTRVYLLGSKKVVITDGPAGAYSYDGEIYYKIGIFPSKVVDRTGAGDSFGSGFVSALVFGKEVSEALVWGALNSAFVVNKLGPMDGLLKKTKLLGLLRNNTTFKASKI